jgi:predicted membrane protein
MSRDLRKYASQTSTRFVIGGIFLIFFIGVGLIYGFYGKQAAIMGLFCMGLGLTPILLIWFILWIIEWLTKRVEQR